MAQIDEEEEIGKGWSFLDPDQQECKQDESSHPDEQKSDEAEIFTYQTGRIFIDLKYLITSEPILSASVFKTPNNKYQPTCMFLRHEYVVFETKKYWWSIEKMAHNGSVWIQRSPSFSSVAAWFRGEERIQFWWRIGGLRRLKTHKLEPSSLTICDFFQYLDTQNEDAVSEHWLGGLESNFARRVFNYLSRSKSISDWSEDDEEEKEREHDQDPDVDDGDVD
ncbi:uncharacterized protein LOC142336788 [Convolutriloba macropyga]|uniref:uncharacterized protein LOC142336788 n=1 Tax=Convolutriloba macropyga TaxID=536237 RepID=UPI003F522274